MMQLFSRKLLILLAVLAAGPAVAGPVVNLDASNTNGGAFVVSPVLQAGTYLVSVVGVAGGGAYNAFAYEAPTAANPLVYSDAFSVCTYNCVVSNPDSWNAQFAYGGWYQSYEANLPTGIWGFDSASAALDAWEAAGPFSFTLTTATTVTFAVDDFATYGDDTGGISLTYNFVPGSGPQAQVAAPEPASLALMLSALLAMAIAVTYARCRGAQTGR